ncbi:unnamed protein product, partial [Ascophyllum nodosum]
EKFRAYLPSPGAVTNGKVWADWLRIPEELNFATSSGSMTASYRSRESCTGYTGEGEDFPTGTLEEQIDRYFNDIGNNNETLEYTHVILLGANDISHFFSAVGRYQLGQLLQEQGAFGDNAYEDPVPYNQVFKVVDGTPQINVELLVSVSYTPQQSTEEVVTTLSTGIERLVSKGVTGRILIANIPSFRGLPDLVLAGVAEAFDEVAIAMGAAIEELANTNPQRRLIDVYTLFAAVVDDPSVFEKLGFSGADGASEDNPVPLGIPCLQLQFASDSTAEIMGTQALRAEGCQEECALCVDTTSPCQNCYAGNPSATICDDPDSRIFWDTRHPTTAFHLIFAEAIRQCSKDQPNGERPFVKIICPDV